MNKKYYTADNQEILFFASANEDTLPSREAVLEEIEKCVPMEFSIVNHIAYYTKPLWVKYTIRYDVDKVGSNRYRITLWYDENMGIVQYLARMAALILGGMACSGLGGAGVLIGCVAGALLSGFLIDRSKKDVGRVCDMMAVGLREYERAHLLSLKIDE